MKKIFSLLILASVSLFSFGQPVKWYTIEEAMAMTKKEPRKIVIDVYTTWCKWCKVMDTATFQNPVVAGYLNKKFYPVKFNAEQHEDVVFEGKTYKFVAGGGRGYHELAAALLNGNMGYPSIVFLDEKGQMIQPMQGYIKAKQFDQIIKYVGEDLFKTQKWEDFLATYVSPVKE
ncbi:MAG: thioredoxin-related protein [Bacteroidetes bacterium]|jgi:thioredoxin-related protein|nr:thioredoxin-related protein [Bacteroidota bacterium]